MHSKRELLETYNPLNEQEVKSDEQMNPHYVSLLLKQLVIILNEQRGKKKPSWHSAYLIIEDILKCAQIDLKETGSVSIKLVESLDQLIFSLIHYNEVDFLKKLAVDKDFLLAHIKKINPQKYYNYSMSGYCDVFIHACAEDALETTIWLIELGLMPSKDHMEEAIINHAKSVARYLVDNFFIAPDMRAYFTQLALEKNDITIINLLNPDKQFIYFKDLLKKLDQGNAISFRQVLNHVSKAYRFSSIEEVDFLCEKFIAHVKDAYASKKDAITTIKQAFYISRTILAKWQSQIALYHRDSDLSGLKSIYDGSENVSYEMYLGIKNYHFLKEILVDKEKNIYSWSYFLQKFTAYRAKKAQSGVGKETKGDSAIAEKFATLRTEKDYVSTPCSQRYDVHHHIVENELQSATPFYYEETINNSQGKLTSGGKGYSINFGKQWLSSVNVNLTSNPSDLYLIFWRHGRCKITEIAPEISITLNTILAMDSKKVQKNPKIFYDELVKLLWLIGNATPVLRGTGFIVESLLGLLHEYHNFSPPVLNGYQLDCLNISFRDLERYRQLFPYFFKSQTLPLIVQSKIKLNYDTSQELRDLLTKYRLDPPIGSVAEPSFFKDIDLKKAKSSAFWKEIFKNEIGDSSKLIGPGCSEQLAFFEHNAELEKPITDLKALVTRMKSYPCRLIEELISPDGFKDLIYNICNFFDSAEEDLCQTSDNNDSKLLNDFVSILCGQQQFYNEYLLIVSVFAIDKNNSILAEKILNYKNFNPNAFVSSGHSMLMLAADSGRMEIVCLILQHPQINVNLITKDGFTALHYAARSGNVLIVELLLKHNNSMVNPISMTGETPLSMAVRNGQTAVISVLLKYMGHHILNNDACLLRIAVLNNNIEVVKELLKHASIIIDHKGAQDATPLFLAANKGYAEILDLLILNKADINLPINASIAVLQDYAKQNNKHQEFQALLRAHDIDATQPLSGFTPLHAAIFYGNLACINLLLAAGASLEPKTGGISAMELATVMNRPAIIERIKEGVRSSSKKVSSYPLAWTCDASQKIPPSKLTIQNNHALFALKPTSENMTTVSISNRGNRF